MCRRDIGGAVLAGLVALIIWTAAYATQFRGLSFPDACDYATVARQLSHGEGLSTLEITPGTLAWLGRHGIGVEPPWPNVHRFPLPVVVRALSFSLFGASDVAAVVPDGLFFAVMVVCVYLLAARLYGPWAAVFAVALVATNGRQLFAALTGLSETGAGLAVVASALVLAWSVESSSRRRLPPFALGAVLALAVLQRTNLAVLVPVALGVLAVARRGDGIRAVSWAAAAFFAVCVPWWVRSAVWFGTPFASLSMRGNWLAGEGRGTFDPGGLVELLSQPLTVLSVFGEERIWLLPLFLLVGVGGLTGDRRAGWFYALGVTALSFVVLGATFFTARYMLPFAPLLAVHAVGGATVRLREQSAPIRSGMGALAVGVVLLSGWGSWDDFPLRGGSVYDRGTLDAVRDLFEPHEVVASRVAPHVAWHAARPSVSLVHWPRVEQLGLEVDGVLVATQREHEFAALLEGGRGRAAFARAERLPSGYSLWKRLPPPARPAEGRAR